MDKYQKRLWSDTTEAPEFPGLHGDAKTDVLIIGGGAAGILCAYHLRQSGVNYILVEGDRILSGVTGGTTAKITSQHGLIYNKLVRSKGYEAAGLYLKANESAINEYKKLGEKFPCDFEERPSYVYSLDNKEEIEAETEAVRRLGFPAETVNNIELPFKVAAAVKFPNQAQLDPAKLFYGIAKELNIYEKTFIRELAPNRAVTDSGTIEADKIIIATHFPILNKHGAYFLKLYQFRSYVIALENAPLYEGMYIDATGNGLSFRTYKNLLLLGGGGGRTGKNGGNWHELRAFARKYYPSASEKYFWAAQDCMTLDSVPYIGKYSRGSNDIYVSAGFNKWGMTSSMIGGKLLADIITGNENEYRKLFSPSRSIIHPQLFTNAGEATANLMTFGHKRCPHMGCALKWNGAEHTWDCSCHGSRFDEDGRVIDNPSTGNLRF